LGSSSTKKSGGKSEHPAGEKKVAVWEEERELGTVLRLGKKLRRVNPAKWQVPTNRGGKGSHWGRKGEGVHPSIQSGVKIPKRAKPHPTPNANTKGWGGRKQSATAYPKALVAK